MVTAILAGLGFLALIALSWLICVMLIECVGWLWKTLLEGRHA